jgi:glycosyltransferase involved in cell wall biosynthesis
MPVRVWLLIRSLERGGAQQQVVHLASGLRARGVDARVVVFYDLGGGHAEALATAGVPLVVVGKRGRWDVMRFGLRMRRLARSERPDYILSYLPTANVVASMLAIGNRRTVVALGVRGSDADPGYHDRLDRVALGMHRHLARLAGVVIANNEPGRRSLVSSGVPAERTAVVPNGIDVAWFRPDAGRRDRQRARWQVGPDDVVFGMAGTMTPVKGVDVALGALARVVEGTRSARLVGVGRATPAARHAFERQARALGVADRVVWIGEQSDLRSFYNGIDILVSASQSEGFPNVVGEAMACGRPVVVTDVGDSAAIVGDAGRVVPPDDVDSLAAAMTDLAEDSQRDRLGEQARKRIVEHFSVDALVDSTLAVLAEHT